MNIDYERRHRLNTIHKTIHQQQHHIFKRKQSSGCVILHTFHCLSEIFHYRRQTKYNTHRHTAVSIFQYCHLSYIYLDLAGSKRLLYHQIPLVRINFHFSVHSSCAIVYNCDEKLILVYMLCPTFVCVCACIVLLLLLVLLINCLVDKQLWNIEWQDQPQCYSRKLNTDQTPSCDLIHEKMKPAHRWTYMR